MKIEQTGWPLRIAIFLTIINLGILGTHTYQQVQAQVAIQIPELLKDQSYVIEINSKLPSCVDIENELGLSRGAVTQLTEEPSGKVIVTFAKDQEINAEQIIALRDIVSKHIGSITAEELGVSK